MPAVEFDKKKKTNETKIEIVNTHTQNAIALNRKGMKNSLSCNQVWVTMAWKSTDLGHPTSVSSKLKAVL